MTNIQKLLLAQLNKAVSDITDELSAFLVYKLNKLSTMKEVHDFSKSLESDGKVMVEKVVALAFGMGVKLPKRQSGKSLFLKENKGKFHTLQEMSAGWNGLTDAQREKFEVKAEAHYRELVDTFAMHVGENSDEKKTLDKKEAARLKREAKKSEKSEKLQEESPKMGKVEFVEHKEPEPSVQEGSPETEVGVDKAPKKRGRKPTVKAMPETVDL